MDHKGEKAYQTSPISESLLCNIFSAPFENVRVLCELVFQIV
jgi:hypothetical protein